MVSDIPKVDLTAFTRIESYHQAHYYEKLTDCVTCLFGLNFSPLETKIWSDKINQLYDLNENFLDDIVNQLLEKGKIKSDDNTSVAGNAAHLFGQIVDKIQNCLPFNLGHLFFTAPIFESIKLVSQVTEVIFTFSIQDSITRFLVNQFRLDTNQGHAQAELVVSKSLSDNHALGEKIVDESQALSRKLLKLFMFREMLLQGKISNDSREQAVRDTFLKQAKLENEKQDKIVAIVEVYFIEQLNFLFEQSFKGLFEFQQQLIDEEENDFDRWLGRLFESNESRQIFSRQIQRQFLQATRSFFLQKLNEKSTFGRHPYLYSIAIGLSTALLAITVISLAGTALTTLPLLTSGLTAFAIGFTAAFLLISKLNNVYYKRNPKQRTQLQKDIDILNQNISHINRTIDLSKKTARKELDWLEQFNTINATIFAPKHVLFGYHESWVREYASRYRHAKFISKDLKEKIINLIGESVKQTNSLIKAFQRGKLSTWDKFLDDTKEFLNHLANQKAIDAFELRLKIREQILHIVSELNFIPPQVTRFYTDTLQGQGSDLAYIQHFYNLSCTQHEQKGVHTPYEKLCTSAQRLYEMKEINGMADECLYGDADYRKLLQLPSFDPQQKVQPCEISTYLHNSLHFLLSLNRPTYPGLGLDPLKQPFIPTDEFFLYRMLWFRQLAKLYFKDNNPNDQSNRLYIENFVQRFFNISAQEVFDDILNQSFYMPSNSTYPTVEVNNQTYVIEQLDYIVQSLTLDLACHTTPLTANHILTCYSQDYQQAIDREKPMKLIALNVKQSDLFVQQSEAFEIYIGGLINDTKNFIQYLQNNQVPKSYIDCYQFNIIEQLITLQIDIIIRTNQVGTNSKAYSLANLWYRIDDYLSTQPYQLTRNSGLYRLLDLFRKNPKAIHPFTLPEEQMNEYKDSIKAYLLSDKPKICAFSMWANTFAAEQRRPEAVNIKNV